jgi:hydroxymethylbilane synthase
VRKLDAGEFDAVILAAAGLKRLGLSHRITALLAPEECLPAPGQGALGLECRRDRNDLIELLAALADGNTTHCVTAERAFSTALAGSCNVPLAAYAEITGGRMRLRGFVGAPDGTRSVNGEVRGAPAQAEAIGLALAEDLRSRGAAEILASLQV